MELYKESLGTVDGVIQSAHRLQQHRQQPTKLTLVPPSNASRLVKDLPTGVTRCIVQCSILSSSLVLIHGLLSHIVSASTTAWGYLTGRLIRHCDPAVETEPCSSRGSGCCSLHVLARLHHIHLGDAELRP